MGPTIALTLGVGSIIYWIMFVGRRGLGGRWNINFN